MSTSNPNVYPLIDPDGPVGRYQGLDELDPETVRLHCQFTTPRTGSDGREYFDLADIDERFRE